MYTRISKLQAKLYSGLPASIGHDKLFWKTLTLAEKRYKQNKQTDITQPIAFIGSNTTPIYLRFRTFREADIDSEKGYFDILDEVLVQKYPCFRFNDFVREGQTFLYFDIDTPSQDIEKFLDQLTTAIKEMIPEDADFDTNFRLWSLKRATGNGLFKWHIICPDIVVPVSSPTTQKIYEHLFNCTQEGFDIQCSLKGSLRLPWQYSIKDEWTNSTDAFPVYVSTDKTLDDVEWLSELSINANHINDLTEKQNIVKWCKLPMKAENKGVPGKDANWAAEIMLMNTRMAAYADRAPQIDQFQFGINSQYPPFTTRAIQKQLVELLDKYEVYGLSLENIKEVIVEVLNRHLAFMSTTSTIVFRTYDSSQNIVCEETEIRKMKMSLCNIRIWIGRTKKNTDKYLECFEVWKLDPGRRTLTQRVFNPYPPGSSRASLPHQLNTYEGLIWSPEECAQAALDVSANRSASVFQAHIYNIICRKDLEKFEFLMLCFASKLRRPWQKLENLIVLQGHEGSGKSIVVEAFGRIFGSAFHVCHDMTKVLERFNEELQDRLVVFMDEGFWAGRQAGAGKLKTLITQAEMSIEGKFKPTRTVNNYIWFLLATNSDFCVPAGSAARRYAMYKTAENRRKGNEKNYKEYFEKVLTINNDDYKGLKAWFSQFYNNDVYTEKIFAAFGRGSDLPQTSLKDVEGQRAHTCDSVTMWWLVCLKRGYHVHPLMDVFHPDNLGGDESHRKIREVFLNHDGAKKGRVRGRDYDVENDSYLYKKTWLRLVVRSQVYETYMRDFKSQTLTFGHKPVSTQVFWTKTRELLGGSTQATTLYRPYVTAYMIRRMRDK